VSHFADQGMSAGHGLLGEVNSASELQALRLFLALAALRRKQYEVTEPDWCEPRISDSPENLSSLLARPIWCAFGGMRCDSFFTARPPRPDTSRSVLFSREGENACAAHKNVRTPVTSGVIEKLYAQYAQSWCFFRRKARRGSVETVQSLYERCCAIAPSTVENP